MCGIIGISSNAPVVQSIYDGLIGLQHRGQDSAGIITYDDRFHLKKGNGLVRDVFGPSHIAFLKGRLGLGHVRYTTAGCADAALEAQPFIVNSPYGIALVHNGNLTNYIELKKQLVNDNARYLNTGSDSEVLLNVLADEISHEREKTGNELTPQKIFAAVKNLYKRVKGSYSVICLIAGHGILAFRDPYGIRPLIFGKRQTTMGPEYVFASESVTLDTLGFEEMRDVKPGEAVFITMHDQKMSQEQIEESRWAPCIFEYVYIARPDSVLNEVSVYKARLRMGRYLGQKIKRFMDEKGVELDVVIPVPDTARTSAFEIASELGLPYREGLMKNRYIGRTFIMSGQGERKQSINHKLNAIKLEIEGKNVLLVDDSIVRGNTSRKIVEMVRAAGAKSVYFASACPPLKNPCVYGVDMPTRKEFIAHNLSYDEIAKAIRADGIFYQSLEDLEKAVKKGNPAITNYCTACLSGTYPTPEVTPELLRQVELSRSLDEPVVAEGASAAEEDQLSML